MAKSVRLGEILSSLVTTEEPEEASRTKTGARKVEGRTPDPETGEANYLPLAVLAVGVLIVGWAILRPGVGSPVPMLENQEDPEGAGQNPWAQYPAGNYGAG